MTPAIQILLWILATLVLVPLGWFVLEMIVGLFPRAGRNSQTPAGRVAVLIPAHNEALGIGKMLDDLRLVAPPNMRVLVVADNCSDQTSHEASAAGAEVVERHDAVNRGKGYALDFGRSVLAADPPDVVIILDADCRLKPGSIEALAQAALAFRTPVQALYTFEARTDHPPLVQISNFAVVVKNLIRCRGLERIGSTSLLCGTGMAFTWSVFAAAPIATGDIVEDLGLGIHMVQSGLCPRLVDAAHVTSLPAGVKDSIAQRSRWEHGFLSTALKQAFPTLLGGISRMHRPEIALGMHLLVPPLALLMALSIVMLAVLNMLGWIFGYWSPAIAAGILLSAAVVVTLLAWLLEGRATLSIKSLVQIPLYVLWKIPIYLRFVRKPETSWVRTGRDGE
jgi:cellulose synthase/poly-beta-1,6-N-acetylglucosamine synthase-like glycosyltransferase